MKHIHVARLVATVTAAAAALAAVPAVATPADPGDAAIAAADRAVSDAQADVAGLAAKFAEKQRAVDALNNEAGGLQQAVNKALVDLHDATDAADAARGAVSDAEAEVKNATVAMKEGQVKLDSVARSAWKRGSVSPAVVAVAGAQSASDAFAARSFLKATAKKREKAIKRLDFLRVDAANKMADLKKARTDAENKEHAAKEAEEKARAAIDENAKKLAEVSQERDRIAWDRDAAQARLNAARQTVGKLKDQRTEYKNFITAQAEQEARLAEAKGAEYDLQKAKAEAAEARAARQAADAAVAAAQQSGSKAQLALATSRQQEAVQAVQVAESRADDFAAKAREARQFLKVANDFVLFAAKAVKLLGGLTGATHTSPGVKGSGSSSVENRSTDITVAGATVAAATDGTWDVNAALTEKEATAFVDAPEGTQLALYEDLQGRENPGESYSLAELYAGFDTVTPADLGLVDPDSITAFDGTHYEKVEAVIARAKQYLGTPYAWGGGNAAGPTKGIRDGGVADQYGDYNKIGFDCSGLVLYAFAGVGVALPHYTGYQYQKGEKIAISNIQRGDLLFWGPNAEYHVAIYLGDGQMIEAPQSGDVVKISPVRYGGMSPYAVRLV